MEPDPGAIELEARKGTDLGPQNSVQRHRLSYSERLSHETSATTDMRRDIDVALANDPPHHRRTLTEVQRRARRRLQRARLVVATRSVGLLSRVVRPLKVLRRPVVWVWTAYKRRKVLPPTQGGRKIPVGLGSVDSKTLVDERNRKPYVSNRVSSGVYTVWDFLPRQLVYQFSKLANVYFLFVSVLQMIPSWSTTGSYTTIIPLMLFVGVAMAREGFDDWARHRSDREENSRQVLVAKLDPERGVIDYTTTLWKNVRVGDVVRVLQNEWVPADLVILHSSGPKGQLSVETLALDGETTLKSREAAADVQDAFGVENLPSSSAMCITEDPNLDLYNFEGSVTFKNPDGTEKIIPLGNQNIIYRGSMLRNTASCLGLVVFTGQESKVQMNATRNTRAKAPKLQSLVNKMVMVMACYVLLLSGFSTLASGRIQASKKGYWYLNGLHVTTTQNIMGFIIMFNTLIPLSLYVSMEICKLFQMMLMKNDIDMYDAENDVPCRVQTTSLNEELGQVSYIFSDKTGTLTDNVMLFRKMSIGGFPWLHDLDLYFTEDETARRVMDNPKDDSKPTYLFHKARPGNPQLELAEQLAALPRKSFGGRLSNANRDPRISLSGMPSLARPSMALSYYSRRSRSRLSHAGVRANSRDLPRPSAVSHTPTMATALEELPDEVEPPVWESTANPAKPQTTPSTLTLLEYVMTHPHDPYSRKAKFFLLALALCHSASPEVDLSQEADGTREIEALDYQAASPDELALVAAARDLGYLVVDRQQDSITVRTYPRGFDHDPKDEVYEVLDTIEFTSGRKRMSIVIRFPDGRICLLCKGADNVMIERLRRSLLGPAQTKQKSIHQDTLLRRNLEADLANGERITGVSGLGGGMASLDEVLRRASTDAEIQESGRRSMQMRKRSVEARRSVEAVTAAAAARSRSMDVRPRSPLRPVSLPATGTPSSPTLVGSTVARTPLVGSTSGQVPSDSISGPPSGQITSSADQGQHPGQREASSSHTGTGQTSPIPGHQHHPTFALERPSSPVQAPVPASAPTSPRASMSVRPHMPPAASTPQTPAAPALDEFTPEEFDENTVLERTLEQIDEFSTEGLRTLLYGHRFLTNGEYTRWKHDYDEARASLTDRQSKTEAVGAQIEVDLNVTGATAIEDKLQVGVPEAIDKLRRANIRMWMLTGDKRETAINIGYACRLIKDYSTVVILRKDEDLTAKTMAAIEELEQEQIAHCVVVVDGATLARIENDVILLSLFVDLGLRADSVIVCRASPAQKATMVKSVRKREPSKVMLAIGDGANDIAMIQAADVGIGIAGKEGLQAARSSDYSIGQFRFLLKLLLVHGRWNYVRTCKYILTTFYKEFMFYMGQVVYQRYTMFTGTSLYESWSISMFNTLFTSLTVMCVGIMDQDLSPTTLIAVPELYRRGQRNKELGFALFLYWLVLAMLQCVLIQFLSVRFYGENYGVKDGSLFPLGVTVYTSVIFIVSIKFMFITMMHYITIISILCALISMAGYLVWNLFVGAIYDIQPTHTYFAEHEFKDFLGKELSYWATVWLITVIGVMFEFVVQIAWTVLRPNETDEFQVLEMQPHIMARLEPEAVMELHQGWEYQEHLDTSWTALFRGRWPGQPRFDASAKVMRTNRRRKRDILAEKLRIKSSIDSDREIQEILDRRAAELDFEGYGRSTEPSVTHQTLSEEA